MSSPEINKNQGKLFYITSLFPVVTQTFISRELKELERNGIEVEVVSLKNSPENVDKEDLPGTEIVYVPYLFSLRVAHFCFLSLLKYNWKILKEAGYIFFKLLPRPVRVLKFAAIIPKSLFLVEYLRRQQAAHIIAHWATVPATCAFFISRVSDLPFSFSAHAWDIFVEGNELLLPEKIREAGAVFTCTKYNFQTLKRISRGTGNIILMYHGIELSKYEYSEPDTKNKPLLAAGGSLVPQKGLDVLIRALSLLKEKGPIPKTIIFGEGIEKHRLLKLVESLEMNTDVEFPGTMPHAQVIEMLKSVDIFVMPSVTARNKFIDGLPNVVAEAMACGAAVVASAISGIPELIRNNIDGILVPSGDSAALAGAIERLMNDSAKTKDMSINARKRVEEEFSVARNIIPLIDYLDSLGFHAKKRDE